MEQSPQDPGPAEVITLTPLDGAGTASIEPLLFPELEATRALASDPTRSLKERLQAYEDIIDSEVGDTALTRARNIERESRIRHLYLKFEGGNPTGTQKDRIAFAQAMDAMRRGFDALTVATCGNYGAATAFAANAAGLKAFVFIPDDFKTKRVAEMEALNASIVRVPGDYEAAVRASRERADQDELYDANPGGENTLLQLQAYGQIAIEIYDDLRDAPAVVAVPVSNGTTLAGIYHGFLSLYRRGKTSRIPRMVAGSSRGQNPIVRAFRKGMSRCEDLKPEEIRETQVNEPLVNWHSIDGDVALDAIYRTSGWADDVTDKEMLSNSKTLKDAEGLSVLPASTAGLVAFLDRHKVDPLPGDRYVAVVTGRRS
jgi:threonine synthase